MSVTYTVPSAATAIDRTLVPAPTHLLVKTSLPPLLPSLPLPLSPPFPCACPRTLRVHPSVLSSPDHPDLVLSSPRPPSLPPPPSPSPPSPPPLSSPRAVGPERSHRGRPGVPLPLAPLPPPRLPHALHQVVRVRRCDGLRPGSRNRLRRNEVDLQVTSPPSLPGSSTAQSQSGGGPGPPLAYPLNPCPPLSLFPPSRLVLGTMTAPFSPFLASLSLSLLASALPRLYPYSPLSPTSLPLRRRPSPPPPPRPRRCRSTRPTQPQRSDALRRRRRPLVGAYSGHGDPHEPDPSRTHQSNALAPPPPPAIPPPPSNRPPLPLPTPPPHPTPFVAARRVRHSLGQIRLADVVGRPARKRRAARARAAVLGDRVAGDLVCSPLACGRRPNRGVSASPFVRGRPISDHRRGPAAGRVTHAGVERAPRRRTLVVDVAARRSCARPAAILRASASRWRRRAFRRSAESRCRLSPVLSSPPAHSFWFPFCPSSSRSPPFVTLLSHTSKSSG